MMQDCAVPASELKWIVPYTLHPKRPNEGVGDGQLDVFRRPLLFAMRFWSFPSHHFTDGLGGGLSIDPSGPTDSRAQIK